MDKCPFYTVIVHTSLLTPVCSVHTYTRSEYVYILTQLILSTYDQCPKHIKKFNILCKQFIVRLYEIEHAQVARDYPDRDNLPSRYVLNMFTFSFFLVL